MGLHLPLVLHLQLLPHSFPKCGGRPPLASACAGILERAERRTQPELSLVQMLLLPRGSLEAFPSCSLDESQVFASSANTFQESQQKLGTATWWRPPAKEQRETPGVPLHPPPSAGCQLLTSSERKRRLIMPRLGLPPAAFRCLQQHAGLRAERASWRRRPAAQHKGAIICLRSHPLPSPAHNSGVIRPTVRPFKARL